MNARNENTFLLNDYGRLPELLKLVEAGLGFSILIPRSYSRYAEATRLVDERFGQGNASKWSGIKDSWSVGKDFSFFSLGFNNDDYRAERVELQDGVVVRFTPR